MSAEVRTWALDGIPEVVEGDDVAALIIQAASGVLIEDDIVVVTSKIVSKAEGRVASAADRNDAIAAETVRVVATRATADGETRIVQNRQGFVMAAAGVDSSNVADGSILLLPRDPDHSARLICERLREALGFRVGVLITDTFGRPWREGQTDVAIGAAGLDVVVDRRGQPDSHGRILAVSIEAVGDEIAGMADLAKGKTSGTPVAVVRGLGRLVTEEWGPGAVALVRDSSKDMFSLGSAEAYEAGFAAGRASVTGRG